MDKLVEALRRFSKTNDSVEDYLIMNSKYIAHKIDAKNFHKIVSDININDTGSVNNESDIVSEKILFVDGGSTVLFESAEFCIGFIRVGGIFYEGTKRVSREFREFYVLVRELNEKYIVKTYPETSFDNLLFDPEDETLKNGIEKCGISKIVSIIRRFAEIEFATDASEKTDYVIMDGTLESRYMFEDKYLDKLVSTGKIFALSKTCSLTTKNGYSITRKLLDLGNITFINTASSWYYYPIITNKNPKHPAEMYFVKLHENTNYVFRFEVQNTISNNSSLDNDSNKLLSILSLLVKHSKDPIFLGYPYGLIDVDQYVRISEEESKLLRTKISVKLGKDWNELSKSLNSTNAHSILDHIKF